MRHLALLFIGIFLTFGTLLAQQLPLYTLYRDNWPLLNPAGVNSQYILYEKDNNLSLSFRNQWMGTGLDGAPYTVTASYQRISPQHKVVLGASFTTDRADAISTTGAMASFAYRLPLDYSGHVLSFGLSAGIRQYKVDLKEITFRDINDIAAMEPQSQLFPDFSLGVFYNYEEKFYAGISVPQVFELNTSFRNTNGELSIGQVRHIYAIVGGYFSFLRNSAAFIEPSVWVRSVPSIWGRGLQGASLLADFNVRAQLNQAFWVGAGAGTSRMLHLETGVIPADLLGKGSLMKIGLGYDYSLYPYGGDLGHTLELNVSCAW